MNIAGPEFYFDGMAVGSFLGPDGPRIAGCHPYKPYRSLGHYELHTLLRARGLPRCYYEAAGMRVTFIVQGCPEYGVLELTDFESAPLNPDEADATQNMQLIDPSIVNLAKTYVAYLHSDDEALQWASTEVIDLSIEGPWERLWQLIQAIVALPDEPSLEVLAFIAAGPLEDLLAKAGPDYISAVEELARNNARAARMLTGVWPSTIHPAIWQRVVTFCRTVPDPIDGVYEY